MLLIAGFFAMLTACGEKLPLPANVIDNDSGRLVDTTYVPALPFWTSADGIPFRHPHGIAIGYDYTIYVCDTDNDRIVRLTPGGDFIESFALEHPYSVAQDRAFNLVAVNNTGRIWLRRYGTEGGFELHVARDSNYQCGDDPKGPCGWYFPKFTNVAASRDPRSLFYAVISGRALRFDIDVPWYPVYVDSGLGLGRVDNATGIAVGEFRNERFLLVAQFAPAWGVQYFSVPLHSPVVHDTSADIYFVTDTGMKYVASSERGNVYVLQQLLGNVLVFSYRGKLQHTFGQTGNPEFRLSRPSAIAVFDETILVADTDNNRIARYQMTNFPQH
jgi:hypothetical protein